MCRGECGTVLLVEDECITAMMEVVAIRHLGYGVTLAKTGEEALRLVSRNLRFDLVLMDVNLGAGMDGIDAAFELRKLVGIPIIFLTSSTESEVCSRAQGLSSWSYLQKLEIAKLEKAIRDKMCPARASMISLDPSKGC